MESNVVCEITNGDGSYDLSSVLCSPERDYLVRNSGDQVIVLSHLFIFLASGFLLLVSLNFRYWTRFLETV